MEENLEQGKNNNDNDGNKDNNNNHNNDNNNSGNNNDDNRRRTLGSARIRARAPASLGQLVLQQAEGFGCTCCWNCFKYIIFFNMSSCCLFFLTLSLIKDGS